MRMMPSRYMQPQPAQIKRQVAQIKHLSAPLKGLSLSSKLVAGDPLTAPVLDNWVVEADHIHVRPGHRLVYQYPEDKPLNCLIPFSGDIDKIAVAQTDKLLEIDGTLIEEGFTSPDWHWSAFSNLSATDYTILVNGFDGVWSWDGATLVKETVTAPSGATHIIPDAFNIVMSHMNRLWFADKNNLAVYYLPLQQKTGEVKELPLNAVFKRGGSIRALHTWTLDGGMGMDDQMVIFSTNGEAAIYGGTDPDTDVALTGVFRFDSPMSKRSVVNYGGDLYCLVSTGLLPMSKMLRAESEQLGKQDRDVFSMFTDASTRHRGRDGWSVILDHSTGRMICNLPLGGIDSYRQMVRFMPNQVWASWSMLPARSWVWSNNRLLIGSDKGGLYEVNPLVLNDNGKPIRVDVQAAWSTYNTPAIKHFKMILPYLQSDSGALRPFIDMRVDYDTSPPLNQPDATTPLTGVAWDEQDWDEADWAQGLRVRTVWTGVSAMGRVAAPRLVANVLNVEFALSGWDVLYEPGAAI